MEQRSLDFLPWQTQQKERLETLLAAERLPHAWLFHGPRGTGKKHFARTLSFNLLCGKPSGLQACGVCHSCQLFLAGHHPDLLLLEADEGKQIINVDKIRDAVDFMQKTANQGGRRIVLIPRAEHMNINASNALLKTLEEPPSGSMLILLSSTPGLLLATIRSRCQALLFPVPPRRAALQWLADNHGETSAHVSLALAGGAPLLAIQYADQDWLHLREQILTALRTLLVGDVPVVALAQSLATGSLHDFNDILLVTAHQLQKHISGQAALADTALAELASGLPSNPETSLGLWYKQLLETRRDLQRGLALNPRLAVETALLDWKHLMRPANNRLSA